MVGGAYSAEGRTRSRPPGRDGYRRTSPGGQTASAAQVVREQRIPKAVAAAASRSGRFNEPVSATVVLPQRN